MIQPLFFRWQSLSDAAALCGRRGTWRHRPSVLRGRRGTCGTGLSLVARLGAVGRPWCRGTLRFAWQVWRLATSTFVLRGRRSTWRHPPSFGVASVALVALGWLWWRAWAPLVARHAAALCVAGVALAHMNFRFAWQVWHLATSTFVLRVRRGT